MCCPTSFSGAPISTIKDMGAGEKAQWFRAQAALPDEQGSMPSTPISAHTVTVFPEDPVPSTASIGTMEKSMYVNTT